jgi:hypothetical protein
LDYGAIRHWQIESKVIERDIRVQNPCTSVNPNLNGKTISIWRLIFHIDVLLHIVAFDLPIILMQRVVFLHALRLPALKFLAVESDVSRPGGTRGQQQKQWRQRVGC